ncbi:hypothetical protein CLU79DRAFT_847982 [Phycomyces nitens]|nr:hypothetical protein CLU79DRAFT_847982 [Phycomyces nitens]
MYCIVNNLHTLSPQAKVSNVQFVQEIYKCTITLSKDSISDKDQLCVEVILQKVGEKDNVPKLPDSLKANVTIELTTTYTEKNLEEKQRVEYGKLSKNNGQDMYEWKFSNMYKFSEISVQDTSQISVHVNLEDAVDQTRIVSSQSIAMYPAASDSHDIRVVVIGDKVLNSRVFYCHKVLLADLSPLLKAIISRIPDNAENRDITISGIRPEIFEKLFTFMYTSKYNGKSVFEASEVIRASTRLQFCSIRYTVFDYLRANITFENLWIIWDLSVNYGCEQAVHSCEEFARKEAKHLLNSQGWLELDQESITKMICLEGLPLNITKTLLHTALLSWRTSTINNLMAELSGKSNSNPQSMNVSDTQRYFREHERYPKSEEEVEKAFFEMTQLICSSHISIHRMRKQTKRVCKAIQPSSTKKIIFKPIHFDNDGLKKQRNC